MWWERIFIRPKSDLLDLLHFFHTGIVSYIISQATNQLRDSAGSPINFQHQGHQPTKGDQSYHGQPSSYSMKLFMGLYMLLPFHGWFIFQQNPSFFPMVEPDFYSSSTNFPFGDKKKLTSHIFGARYKIINPHLCWWFPTLWEVAFEKISKQKTFNQQTLRTRMVNMCVCVWKQFGDEGMFTYPQLHVKSDNFNPAPGQQKTQ